MIDLNCEWESTPAGARSVCCGWLIPGADAARCYARCGKRNPPEIVVVSVCRHLGAALDEFAKVRCRSCRGNVRLKVRAFACNLHGKCLPDFRPSSEQAREESRDYQLCEGCPDRTVTRD